MDRKSIMSGSWAWTCRATSSSVVDFTIDDLFAQGFDAVYLAIGCWTSNAMNVPGEDAEGVVNAISYLA